MTDTIAERLRARKNTAIYSGARSSHVSYLVSEPMIDEAADTIQSLEAERDRYKKALERIVEAGDFYSQPETDGIASRYAHESSARFARAALEEKL